MGEKYRNLFGLIFLLLFAKFGACSSSQEMSGFLVDLARTRSPHCSIVFIRQNGENWDDLVTGVMSNLRQIPYYNAVFYNLPDQSYKTNFSVAKITQNQKAAMCKMAIVLNDGIQTGFLEQIKT